MNLMLQFDGAQNGAKVLKSGIRNDEDSSGELLNLLKKTQSKVSSLENEITRVEAENIHQDRDHRTSAVVSSISKLII